MRKIGTDQQTNEIIHKRCSLNVHIHKKFYLLYMQTMNKYFRKTNTVVF